MLTPMVKPRNLSWSRFPSKIQPALSLCVQKSVAVLNLIEISDLSVSLLAAILQHLNLTSFQWSYISLDPQI